LHDLRWATDGPLWVVHQPAPSVVDVEVKTQVHDMGVVNVFEETYDAIDLAEWYYVLTWSFCFDTPDRWTQLRFLHNGPVSWR